MISSRDFIMDLSTFWKVLWLISFRRIFEVIAISFSFWSIPKNYEIKNFFYDKVGYYYVT